MKKTLFLLPIAMMAIITFATHAANANAAKVYKQTATVYQIKKTGKTYKITSQAKKTADRDLNISKIINVKGKSYYYSKVFKGYINDNAYGVNAKLDAKRAKVDMSSSNTGKKKNTTTNSSDTDSNNNSTNAKIVNGYDETNQKIVDMNTFTISAAQMVIDKLNAARQSNGLQPLQVDNNLTKIAQMRAQQSADQGFSHISHYNAQGQPYTALDAEQLNIMSYNDALYSIAENAGIYTMEGLDSTEELANNAINDQLQEGPTGGHYQNDMNSSYKRVGVAFHVNSNGDVGFNMDFMNK